MKRIFYLYVMLGIYVFILAGCVTEPPAYRIGPDGTILSLYPYTEWDRTQACVPIYPFNGNKAFESYDKPILWTFGVNFDVLSGDGNPLGCLRLYRLDPTSSEITWPFVPIDGGGILVETCQISPSVFIVGGEANFAGKGHIQCKMNLKEWVQNLAAPLWPYTGELQEFSNAEIHVYENFTMVAALNISSAGPTGIRSAMYYKPSKGSSVDLSVNVVDLGNGLVATAPVDTCMETPQPTYPIKRTGLWWYDLRKERALQYYAYTTDSFAYVRMLCTVSSETTLTPSSGPIQFWTGEATLYIGSDPTEENRFYGSIDGILIDPVDSKPPN